MKKRHFRTIPQHVSTKLQRIVGNYIKVGTSFDFTQEQAKTGELAYLGITFSEDGGVVAQERVFPSPARGRFSRLNTNGTELVHRDRDKVTKTFSDVRPNYGDPSKGYHWIFWDRLVYQRSRVLPPLDEFMVRIVPRGDGIWNATVSIARTLDKNAQEFKTELNFMLNLVAEQCGFADVSVSTLSEEQFKQSERIDWEVFPPGTRERMIQRILRSVNEAKRQVLERQLEIRLKVMEEIAEKSGRVVNWYYSDVGLAGYFAADFGDGVVVLENIRYGNALYVLGEDWKEISRRSRTEILRGAFGTYERITHRGYWPDRLRAYLRKKITK